MEAEDPKGLHPLASAPRPFLGHLHGGRYCCKDQQHTDPLALGKPWYLWKAQDVVRAGRPAPTHPRGQQFPMWQKPLPQSSLPWLVWNCPAEVPSALQGSYLCR